MPQPLSAFVEELLVKAGMVTLPEDFRQQYILKLVSQVEERIGLKALAELDEEELAEFERMMQPPKPPAEVLAFFRLHIRDFPEKMQAVLDEFTAEFLQHATSARQALRADTPAT